MKKIVMTLMVLSSFLMAGGNEFGIGALDKTTDWNNYNTVNAVIKYKDTKWEFPGEGIAGEYLVWQPELGAGFSMYVGLGLEYHWRTLVGLSGRASVGLTVMPLSFMDIFFEAVPKFNFIASSGGVDYNLGLRFYFE